MQRTVDVAVLGGGIIGLSCARALAKLGRSVVVLERGRIGREASWAAAGVLAPIHLADYPEPLVELVSCADRLYPDFVREVEAESGVSVEYTRCGLLLLVMTEKDRATAERLVRWKTARGQLVERLTGREAREREPALSSRVRSAVLLPDVAQVRNHRLCRALAGSVVRFGGRILEQTPCLGIRDGRVPQVEVPGGTIRARHVVVATGAWAGELAGKFGVEVRPIRGQIVLVEGPPGWLRRIVVSGDRYLVPRADGRVLIGSTVEDVGFDRRPTVAGVDLLLRKAREMAPGIDTFEFAAAWAGLRPSCGDRIPRIGPVPRHPGIWISAGHYRNGILLAPAQAELLAALICGRPPPVDPSPFRIRR